MYSDGGGGGSSSDGSGSEPEETGRDRKAHKRSGGKTAEKKKKHDKQHKKHKKSKKHKKHRHQSEGDSEEKSDDGGSQQPSPQRYDTGGTKDAASRGDRGGLVRAREPPQEHPRPARDERLLKESASSRWDSPGDTEGRHFHSTHNNDHSRSQRTRPDDSGYRHEERYQRETNRRRLSPRMAARSRSPSAEQMVRGRGEHRERRRYSEEEGRRAGPARFEDQTYRGNRNGKEQRDAERFDDGRSRPNRRNDNHSSNDYGSRRPQQADSWGVDENRQRRYSSPNPSSSSRRQQPVAQRGRDRPHASDERDERPYRGERPHDNRGEFRDRRPHRGPPAEHNRDWRGAPDGDRDRNRRDRNDDREAPVEVKIERPSSSPRGSRGHSHSQQRGRDRSPAARPVASRGAPRRGRAQEQEDEADQFEWGGGRRDGGNREATTGQPHVPRTVKVEGDADDGGAVVKKEEPTSDSEPPPKQKPNFGLSGKLTEEANKVNGTVIAYAEPPGARKPKRRWRLYPFKGEQALPTLYIHRQSCYLIGRDRKVCDLPVDHPSCSKQHAVLQYRLVPYQKADGSTSQRVRPYIIDLESANGTFVNNKKIEPKRYLELFEKDVLKFGFSSREYVVLHENSKEDTEDDDGYEVSPTSKPFAGANSNIGPN